MSKSSTAVSVKPKKARPPRQRVPASGIRCTHVDAAGRRCRSLALKSVRGAKAGYTSGLCPAHATEDRMFRETELVGKYLFKNTLKLDTTAAVNHVLDRLFQLIAFNRIPMRNAALLTYLGSLLLNSVGDVKGEVARVKGSDALDGIISRAFQIIDSDSDEESDSDSDSEEGSEEDSDSEKDLDEESNSDSESAADSGDRPDAEIEHAPDYDPVSDAESNS